MEAFKARHQAVIRLVKKKASAKRLQSEVDRLLDYQWIAQTALGGKKRFQGNCEPRCAEFEGLLAQLIRENYLRLVRKAQGNEVEYLEQVKGKRGNSYLVKTRISIVKAGRPQKITVAYVMHKPDGEWKVKDIITDDVSLAKTYRFEFNQIRKREGIDGLIAGLERKLADLAAKK